VTGLEKGRAGHGHKRDWAWTGHSHEWDWAWTEHGTGHRHGHGLGTATVTDWARPRSRAGLGTGRGTNWHETGHELGTARASTARAGHGQIVSERHEYPLVSIGVTSQYFVFYFSTSGQT